MFLLFGHWDIKNDLKLQNKLSECPAEDKANAGYIIKLSGFYLARPEYQNLEVCFVLMLLYEQ